VKQCITQEQYESLSDQGRQKYIEWVLKKQSIIKDYHDSYRSIQHLILFIDEYASEGWWNIERIGYRKYWRIQGKYDDFDEEGETELIDALWEAVKVLLGEDVE